MSQLISTTDDVGFDGNQCVAITDGVPVTDTVSVFTNTFLIGRTLRATDSRFQEPSGSRRQAFKISLLTRTSLLNNTNDNQGDHCILALQYGRQSCQTAERRGQSGRRCDAMSSIE